MRFKRRRSMSSRHVITPVKAEADMTGVEIHEDVGDYDINLNRMDCCRCENVYGTGRPVGMMRRDSGVRKNGLRLGEMRMDNWRIHVVNAAAVHVE
jgi:hypothetical protein